jgi:maleamate amidohydrolase
MQQPSPGPFDGHLQPGERPALLLIDMVEAYLDPKSPLYCQTAKAALDKAGDLLEAARSASRPVIFTDVHYDKGGANGGLFYRKIPVLSVFDEGSPLGAFPAALQPRDGEIVVTKQYPSAFFDTGLAAMLSERGVDTLIIAGYSTSGCVRASALDALQHGFAPFVVRDACADRDGDVHEANLSDLQAKYAEVIASGMGCKMLV